MNKTELEAMSSQELRKLARTVYKGAIIAGEPAGKWINGIASKSDLIAKLDIYYTTGGTITTPLTQALQTHSNTTASTEPAYGAPKPAPTSTPAPTIKTAPAKAGDKQAEALKALLETLNPQTTIDEAEIERVINKAMEPHVETLFASFTKLQEDLSKNIIKTIELKDYKGNTTIIDKSHYQMPDLLINMNCRRHTFIVGPAGSSKTFSADQVAKALGLEFEAVSINEDTDKDDLLGYISQVTGDYQETATYRRFKNGGILLWDEIDKGNPNATSCLNMITENGDAYFPCGLVKRHPDFVCIATGNTWGHGASRDYVGANQLDGAFLSRFANISWDYDENLELAIAGDIDWTKRVQEIRKAVFALKIRTIVSPRASITGAILLKAGKTQAKVEAEMIFNSMGAENQKKVEAYILNGGN